MERRTGVGVVFRDHNPAGTITVFIHHITALGRRVASSDADSMWKRADPVPDYSGEYWHKQIP